MNYKLIIKNLTLLSMVFRAILFLICISHFSSSVSLAQSDTMRVVKGEKYKQQVGFSNPNQFKELINYRLPDWGYKAFTINGSSYGNLDSNMEDQSEFDNGETSGDSLRTGTLSSRLSLNTTYLLYQESELKQVTMRIEANSTMYVHKYDRLERNGFEEAKDNNAQFNGSVYPKILYQQRRYRQIQSDQFILFRGSFDTQLGKNRSTQNSERNTPLNEFENRREQNGLNNSTDLNLLIGFGKGRLRNVTPVMRAIRFSDRLNAIGKFEKRSPDQIQLLAQQFAKQSGYQNSGFRTDKFFWDDVFSQSGIGESLSPFEVNYLQEVPLENLGSRYEGSLWSTGIEFRGSRDFWKTRISRSNEDFNTNSRSEINALGISWNSNFEYSKNLNLEWQYSHSSNVELGVDKMFMVSEDENNIFYQASANHTQSLLKSIADRWLLRGSATFEYAYLLGDNPYQSEDNTSLESRFLDIGLDFRASYFIERSTSISFQTGAGYIKDYDVYTYDISDRENRMNNQRFRFQYNISITHFFGGAVW